MEPDLQRAEGDFMHGRALLHCRTLLLGEKLQAFKQSTKTGRSVRSAARTAKKKSRTQNNLFRTVHHHAPHLLDRSPSQNYLGQMPLPMSHRSWELEPLELRWMDKVLRQRGRPGCGMIATRAETPAKVACVPSSNGHTLSQIQGLRKDLTQWQAVTNISDTAVQFLPLGHACTRGHEAYRSLQRVMI